MVLGRFTMLFNWKREEGCLGGRDLRDPRDLVCHGPLSRKSESFSCIKKGKSRKKKQTKKKA